MGAVSRARQGKSFRSRFRVALLSAVVRCVVPIAYLSRASANVTFEICRRLASVPFGFRALAIIWMDQLTGFEKHLLRHGGDGTSHGPRFVGGGQSCAAVRLPDVGYYIFEDACVAMNASAVILQRSATVIERALGPDKERYDYAVGPTIAHDHATAVVWVGTPEPIECGIFLGGNGSANYYHWLAELLTKLEFLPQLPDRYREYPLLVGEDAIKIPAFRDTLGLFAKGCEVIALSNRAMFDVRRLVYINCPNNLPFNFRGNQRFGVGYAATSPQSIAFIRNKALAAAFATPNTRAYPERIFLARKNDRRAYNQDEVFECLSKSGFTIIFMEDLDFLEQVRTIQHADVIAGPSGAAWTNLMFARPGSKGLCWMAEAAGDFSAYSNIAAIVGTDLRYVTFKTGAVTARQLYRADYYLDPEDVVAGLEELGV